MHNLAEENWQNFFKQSLLEQRQKNLYRNLIRIDSPPAPVLDIQGQEYIHFCSNDYLGLASDPRLQEACTNAAAQWGSGAAASPLISGRTALMADLEDKTAGFKHTPAAIVYCSGYAANTGSIPSLTGPKDLILSDELNHASIVDGCRLSKAEVCIYPHRDLQFIEDRLKNHRGRGKILLLTDGVFSMDGVLAPLPQLVDLSRKYNFQLYIDDAHATGVLGETGRGSLEYFGLESEGIIQMGTYSKALGSLGGFVCGDSVMIEYLVNRSRTLIYSTALPPPVMGASLQALQILKNDPEPRNSLIGIGRYLRMGLQKLGIPLAQGVDHIISLIIGGNRETLQLQQFLGQKNIFVPAIRPPTVPQNKSRLRLSISSRHTQAQIDQLTQALQDFFRQGA